MAKHRKSMTTLACVGDFEREAKERMDPVFWSFYASYSGTGETYRRNLEAFKNLKIVPQFLRKSVGERDLGTSIFKGSLNLNVPLGVSPTAFMRYAHSEGEIGAAKEKAGFKAIVVSVDIPILSKAPSRTPDTLDLIKRKADSMHIVAAHFQNEELWECRIGDASATWKDFEEICKFSNIPVIAKGIMSVSARDANEALAHGAAGILVSNHGGRQLDSMLGTIEALPEVVKAVEGRCDVFVDGGVRTGTDVFKALALGAKAVFIGRPALWGLAYNGGEGATKVLEILREELDLTMALSGGQMQC